MHITAFDPTRVLGCSRGEAEDLLRGHVVTPGEVEGVALQTYNWRAHRRDPESYWVTVGQAAEILGRSRSELEAMLSRRSLPYDTHVSGVRLMRRREIEEIAGVSPPRAVPA